MLSYYKKDSKGEGEKKGSDPTLRVEFLEFCELQQQRGGKTERQRIKRFIRSRGK
jgi:hypothetical protein